MSETNAKQPHGNPKRAARNAYMREWRKKNWEEHPEKQEEFRTYMREYMRKKRSSQEWKDAKEDRAIVHALNLLARKGYDTSAINKPVASHEGGITE